MEYDKISFHKRIKNTKALRTITLLTFSIMATSQTNTSAFAQDEMQHTNSAIFRPGSYFTITSAFRQSNWQLKNAGSIESASDNLFGGSILLKYAFHFQILKNFGGIAGSNLELEYEPGQINVPKYADICTKTTFRPGPSFSLPSILLGTVYNFTETTRILADLSYSAAWYPWMSACGTGKQNSAQIRAIPHSIDANVSVDLFQSQAFAWTLGVGVRARYITCIGTHLACSKEETRTSILEKFSMFQKNLALKLGITWQTASGSKGI